MFTGLITDLGRVMSIRDAGGVRRFEIESGYAADTIETGDSIAHSGVCLTVLDHQAHGSGSRWSVEAVPETLARSKLGSWTEGTPVNLEQSLRLGDKLGGHFVFGHVDGLGQVTDIVEVGDSWRLHVDAPEALAPFLATKGSVAVDGISLTIARADAGQAFELAIIPHTWSVTTLRHLTPGDPVNLEIDMLARYVARMLGKDT